MNRKELTDLIKNKRSFLCIGLDSDITKIPKHLLSFEDPVFEFNKQIIDATHDVTVAYKPNLAFYESRGATGLTSLEKTIKYLNGLKTKVFTIADAKRGDIGNTSQQYAKAFFDEASSGMSFDAVTVAPYMGEDSVSPFLSYKDKWIIVLALTSNKGADDFQQLGVHSPQSTVHSKKLFEKVIEQTIKWGSAENTMFVVGATRAEMLKDVRKLVPDHFLLIPGVGTQGGSLSEVAENGLNSDCGLLVNSSRGIIFASGKEDFAIKAREEALILQKEMESILRTIVH
jgi:orotidine-5'-phosphate decarboxylase